MSMMKEVIADIQEMLEAGCSRGFIAGELMRNYSMSSKESLRLIVGAEQMMAEDSDNDLIFAVLSGD